MTWMGLLQSVPTVTVRTQKAPTAATAPQALWRRPAPHTALLRSSSEESVWAATWKWPQPQARKLSSWEDTMKTSGGRPCSPAPSQPCQLFTSLSLGSAWELLSLPPCHMPLLGSNTTKCFNASATDHEAQPAICPGLAKGCLPKDGPPPPRAVQTHKVLRPHAADTFPAMIHTSSWWFHNWATSALGWSFSTYWAKKDWGTLGSGCIASSWEPSPPLGQSSLGHILPHLHPLASSVAPGRSRRSPHLREDWSEMAEYKRHKWGEQGACKSSKRTVWKTQRIGKKGGAWALHKAKENIQ